MSKVDEWRQVLRYIILEVGIHLNLSICIDACQGEEECAGEHQMPSLNADIRDLLNVASYHGIFGHIGYCIRSIRGSLAQSHLLHNVKQSDAHE